MSDELRERCILALHAWMHQYAGDMCDEETVKYYRQYILEQGGTLSLIAHLLQDLRNELPART